MNLHSSVKSVCPKSVWSFLQRRRWSANSFEQASEPRQRTAWKICVAAAEHGIALTKDHRTLVRLRNKHVGKRAFLLGNGPSVRLQDLDRLQTEVTFSCNRFHLAYPQTRLRPSYTLSADRQTIEDFGQEIVANSAGVVFMAHPTRPHFAGNFIWLRSGVTRYEKSSPFTPNVYNYVYSFGATLIVALQIGYFMGIREFILYGVDHSYNFQPTGNPDVYRSAEGEGNHFIPNYRSGRPWCPPYTVGIEKGFSAWGEKLRQEGGCLVNATHGGALNVLPRVQFEELF
jgi:hypothetical protein